MSVNAVVLAEKVIFRSFHMRVISADIMAIAQKCVFKKHKIFTGFRPAMVSPECNYNGESVCGVCKYVSHWSNLNFQKISSILCLVLQVSWQARHGWQVRWGKGTVGWIRSVIFFPLLFFFCSRSKMLCYIFKEFLCLVFTHFHNFVGTFSMLVVRSQNIRNDQFWSPATLAGHASVPATTQTRWTQSQLAGEFYLGHLPHWNICCRCNCMFASQAAHLTTLGTSLLRPRVLRMWEM